MRDNSIKKWIITAFVILFLTILQTGATGFLQINSTAPDLLFAFAVMYACIGKETNTVLISALICGIVSDFVCHSHFMGYTAVYSYCALLMYFLKNLFRKPNIFFLNVTALIIFILGKTSLFPVFYFARGVAFSDYFPGNVLPSAVYDTVCFFMICLIWRFVSKRREKRHARQI